MLDKESKKSIEEINYLLKFKLRNDVPEGGVIHIEYPSVIELSEEATCSLINWRPDVSCSLDVDTRKVVVSCDNGAFGWSSYGNFVTLRLSGVIGHASSTTQEIKISSYTDANMHYIIDYAQFPINLNARCDPTCKTCSQEAEDAC